MKKLPVITFVVLFISAVPLTAAKAQDPIALIIKEAVKKVIQAVDLKIQRLQNRTIWLQNAQKTMENTLSKLRLDEITEWVEKQRTLYQDYFEELQKVKSVIAYYHRVREITELQVALVKEYKSAYGAVKKDKHFTVEEVFYIGDVYAGIIEESIRDLDQVALVINSFATQMSDAGRMEIINRTADALQQNYNDLKAFNAQNVRLSLQRARDAQDVAVVKALYGIQ